MICPKITYHNPEELHEYEGCVQEIYPLFEEDEPVDDCLFGLGALQELLHLALHIYSHEEGEDCKCMFI